MRVLSIREPFASLISEKKKNIETRSWKTNYRGELYIHASLSKVNSKDLRIDKILEIANNINLNPGYIICKCTLVDCVYMDENFINDIKKDNFEYLVGRYSVGRYAWVLDNIETIKPIPVKGKLGIWHYNI